MALAFFNTNALRVSNAKYLVFDTQNFKNTPPSKVLNAKYFGIGEQRGLKFETAVFTDCKNFIVFLIQVRAHFLFFIIYVFLSPITSLFPLLSSLSRGSEV